MRWNFSRKFTGTRRLSPVKPAATPWTIRQMIHQPNHQDAVPIRLPWQRRTEFHPTRKG